MLEAGQIFGDLKDLLRNAAKAKFAVEDSATLPQFVALLGPSASKQTDHLNTTRIRSIYQFKTL
jgi:hypothetical protein